MAGPPPFGFTGIPGNIPTIPIAGMRAPLIQVAPLMMPLNIHNQPQPPAPSLAPSTITSGLELSKSYQKPPSVGEMKVATTVFVGNITEKATDSLVRQILLRCGYIVGWKRVQNATGKLQAFGFCEYSDPECTLRSMRLLNGFNLGDKNLVIKVDSNNRKELLKYLMKKKKIKAGEEYDDQILEREVDKIILKGEADSLEEDVDEETKAEDEKVMNAINILVNENISILSGGKTSDDFRREKDVHESLVAMAIQSGHVDEDSTLADVDMEDDMKTLVSDEIKKFRQSYQNYEEKQAEARMKRQQARIDDKDKKKEERTSKRSRSRSPKKSGRAKSPKKAPRSKSQERRDREKERELRRKEEKERAAKEEEEYEQKLLERKRADKERLFKERLRVWEHREKRRAHDYQYEREEEEIKRTKLEKEKRRLIEFLEDYDDEKQDSRYYKGSEFSRRREDRYAEMEQDEYDRKKEKDELEALRLEVMERQIREREEEQQRKKQNELVKEQEQKVSQEEGEEPNTDAMMLIEGNIPISKEVKQSVSSVKIQLAPPISAPELKSNPNEQTDVGIADNDTEELNDATKVPQRKLMFGLNKKQLATTHSSLEGVFGGEDDTDSVKPKKKLYSLMSNSNSAHITAAMASVVPHEGKMTAENRKKLVQSLVNSIPSRREELFNWDLRWNYIDKTLMEKRVSPWINKKIVEYIGEPEPTLTEFICNKLAEQVSADGILSDIAMVLDDEAEVFVLKLWRLLIYETEARHLGIAKTY